MNWRDSRCRLICLHRSRCWRSLRRSWWCRRRRLGLRRDGLLARLCAPSLDRTDIWHPRFCWWNARSRHGWSWWRRWWCRLLRRRTESCWLLDLCRWWRRWRRRRRRRRFRLFCCRTPNVLSCSFLGIPLLRLCCRGSFISPVWGFRGSPIIRLGRLSCRAPLISWSLRFSAPTVGLCWLVCAPCISFLSGFGSP